MLSTDRAEFLKILNGLAAIKRVDLTPEALTVWWGAMADWSLDEFRSAASHLVKSCQFMPSPYDFDQLRKAGKPTSAEAWQLAWRGNPGGDYAIHMAMLAVGGREQMGLTDTDKLHFLERRFCEAYDELVDVVGHRESVPEIAAPRLNGTVLLGDAVKRLARDTH